MFKFASLVGQICCTLLSTCTPTIFPNAETFRGCVRKTYWRCPLALSRTAFRRLESGRLESFVISQIAMQTRKLMRQPRCVIGTLCSTMVLLAVAGPGPAQEAVWLREQFPAGYQYRVSSR